jgi:hypothetical protein
MILSWKGKKIYTVETHNTVNFHPWKGIGMKKKKTWWMVEREFNNHNNRVENRQTKQKSSNSTKTLKKAPTNQPICRCPLQHAPSSPLTLVRSISFLFRSFICFIIFCFNSLIIMLFCCNVENLLYLELFWKFSDFQFQINHFLWKK